MLDFGLNLVVFVGFVEPISVSTPQKHVNVTMGESALLQCTFESTDQTAGLTIQWDFVSPPSMTPQQVETDCGPHQRFAPQCA